MTKVVGDVNQGLLMMFLVGVRDNGKGPLEPADELSWVHFSENPNPCEGSVTWNDIMVAKGDVKIR
jgi:hypothetical protein